MARIVEQTTTKTTKWYSGLFNAQNVVMLITVFCSITYFVFKTQETNREINDKASEKELLQIKEQIKDIDDKVNRQYGAAKDDREKENKAIEEVADWMHEQIGEQRGLKERK